MASFNANMKTLFRAVVILVFIPCACAYIEEIPMGARSSPFSLNDWTPKSFKPKVRIRPMGIGEPETRDEKINIDKNADGIIRREYSAWSKRYDKATTAKRFEIFKRNFVSQMEMNRKNGEFFLLNEYGDLTEEEYIAQLQKSKESSMNEETETKASKVLANFEETLPAAPVKRLEDLTKEVLDSAMEASRKAVAEELQSKMTPKRSAYADMIAGGLASPEKSLSRKAYASLEWETTTRARNLHPSAIHQSNIMFLASYIDFVYAPMEQPDDFDLLPALLSAAITSSAQTILQSNLIDQEEEDDEILDLGWEAYAYAMDFEDSGFSYYY